MVNYSNGKIYKIEPIIDHDEGDIYVGSTTKKYLCQRMENHRSQFRRFQNNLTKKQSKAFDLFQKYGLDNCQIVLIETINASTKDELLSKEKYYIQKLKCVNRIVPLRTHQEYIKETNYYEKNKEKLKNWRDEYNIKNAEHIKARREKYRENHADEIKEKKKAYREKNKEQIKEKKSQKILCECGAESTSSHMSRHQQTQKHKQKMSALKCEESA